MTTRKNIENTLWKACDSFRGKIDSSRYKDYILSMLFVKYLSDLNKERRAEHSARFKGDQQRVERAMSREPFVLCVFRPDMNTNYETLEHKHQNI